MKLTKWFIPLGILLFFLATHVYQLVLLPVFADEAIYIRWSQLIIDDWKQYLFFPLNDGKTPLLMWLTVPFLTLGRDPLFMARLVSVVAGVGQMFAIGAIVKSLGGRRMTVWLSMLLTTILPFWYFHHRMALIDALLTLWLSLTIWCLIRLNQEKKYNPQIKWVGLGGMFYGLALLTKLPAVLLLPAFPLYLFIASLKLRQDLFKRLMMTGAVAAIGIALFVLLKLHPAFSQLFSRGSDFLHPWRYVFLEGGWLQTIKNIPTYFTYAAAYLTLPGIILIVAGLFAPDEKRRRQLHVLFWSMMAFAGPIVLMGRVVYPRYFMPVSVCATVIISLSLETLVLRFVQQQKNMHKKVIASVIVALLLANIVSQSTVFMAAAMTNPAKLPFVSADKEQYLHEWSSGHGITQVVDMIKRESANKKIAVATEGSFGTLPDGILMYLHNENVEHIYVEGIGYPVKRLSPQFVQRAQEFDTAWLVVNSHRLEFEVQLPENKLITEYCRPNGAPCLQVWDITELVRSSSL